MNVESAEVELAYTYAWWLTGEDAAARTAVMTAIDRPDVPGADPDLRLEILLRRVRAAAVSTPTMCPASELALLHDAIGLGLDAAAGLVTIDAREARTELAHGRLEALGRQSEIEMVAPERLGGLAVGNPADVAAARQNPKLGKLRELILQGRDELVGVSRIAVPADLLDAVANRSRRGPIDDLPMEEGWFDQPAATPFKATADTTTAGRARADEATDDEPPDVDARTRDAEDVDADEAAADQEDATAVTATTDVPAAEDESDADAVDADNRALVPVSTTSRRDVLDDLDQSEEIDLSGGTASAGRRGAERARSRRGWLVLALVSIAGLAGLILTQVAPIGDRAGDPAATPDVAQGPVDEPPAATTDPDEATPPAEDTDDASVVAPDDASPEPTGTDDPDGTEPPPTDGPEATEPPAEDVPFTISSAGVAVGIGGDPSPDNPTAGPFEPVSITVDYTGAVEGDALLVDWTVDGEPYDTERAALSPLLETARFTKQVPQEGWPVGQHVLELTLERTGEVVGEARFQVAA